MKRGKPSSAPGSPVLGSVTKKLKTADSAGVAEVPVDVPPPAVAGAGTPSGQDEEGWTKVRKRKDKKQKKVAQRQDVCVSSAPARVREYVTDRLILPFCSLPTSRAYTNPNTWIFLDRLLSLWNACQIPVPNVEPLHGPGAHVRTT
jgi:hypothetical protein